MAPATQDKGQQHLSLLLGTGETLGTEKSKQRCFVVNDVQLQNLIALFFQPLQTFPRRNSALKTFTHRTESSSPVLAPKRAEPQEMVVPHWGHCCRTAWLSNPALGPQFFNKEMSDRALSWLSGCQVLRQLFLCSCSSSTRCACGTLSRTGRAGAHPARTAR